MKITTPAIQSKYALNCAHATDFIDWATDSLAAGLDSPNLRILAGLDRFVSAFEAESHFLKARQELALPNPTKDEAIRDYALHLARELLEPDSDYCSIVRALSALCSSCDYPACMMEWDELDDGLLDIQAGSYPHRFEELYKSDPREVVRGVAHKFLTENSEPCGRDNHLGA